MLAVLCSDCLLVLPVYLYACVAYAQAEVRIQVGTG